MDKLLSEELKYQWIDFEENGHLYYRLKNGKDLMSFLVDIMRENEALLKHPAMLACEKCSYVNVIHPYKESAE